MREGLSGMGETQGWRGGVGWRAAGLIRGVGQRSARGHLRAVDARASTRLEPGASPSQFMLPQSLASLCASLQSFPAPSCSPPASLTLQRALLLPTEQPLFLEILTPRPILGSG